MKVLRSSTGILSIIVAIVIAYVYIFEFRQGEKDKITKQDSLKLFQSKEDEVVKLKIKWIEGESALSKNEKGEWYLDLPIKDNVEKVAVDTILKGIADEVSEVTISEDPNADLAIYGLKDPMGYVEIEKKDGSKQMVTFGTVDALEGKKYAHVKTANKVVVISKAAETRFIKTAKDFRLKKFVKTPRFDVTQLSVKVPAKNTNITMSKESTSWTYLGQKWEVDPQVIEAFLGQIENLSAQDFVSEDKKTSIAIQKYSTNQSVATFILRTKEAAAEEIITVHAAKDGRAFVTTNLKNTVYQITQNAFEALKVSSDHFRNKKRPFEFNKDSIENIEVRTGLVKPNLKKEGADWKPEPLQESKTVDQAQVRKLIDAISELRVNQFIGENRKKSLSSPLGSILLKNKAGEAEFELKWGPDISDKERVAVTNKSNEALSVSKSNLAMLPLQSILQEKAPEAEKPNTQPEVKK